MVGLDAGGSPLSGLGVEAGLHLGTMTISVPPTTVVSALSGLHLACALALTHNPNTSVKAMRDAGIQVSFHGAVGRWKKLSDEGTIIARMELLKRWEEERAKLQGSMGLNYFRHFSKAQVPRGLTLDDFMRTVQWEETDDGIVTTYPEDIPIIEEFLEVWRNSRTYALRTFIEKYGGTWNDEDLSV